MSFTAMPETGDAADVELDLVPAARARLIAKDVLGHLPLAAAADHFVEAVAVEIGCRQAMSVLEGGAERSARPER